MAPPSHLRVERSPSRRHVVLRMENRIVNIGAGPAELFGRAHLADRDAGAAGGRRRRGAAAPDRDRGRAVLQVGALARRVLLEVQQRGALRAVGHRLRPGIAPGWCAPGPSTTTACATSTACATAPRSGATASSARATRVRTPARSPSGHPWAGPTSIPRPIPTTGSRSRACAAASRSCTAPTPATGSSSPTRPTTSRSTIVRLPYKPGPQRCPKVQPVPPAPPVPTPPPPPPAPAPPPPTPPPTV